MNITLFVFLLFLLQFLYGYVGWRSSKKLKDESDYFLAGKNVSLFPLMMTFMATQVGGGVVLGAAEEAYRFGWAILFYPLGAALGFILLGCGIGQKLAAFHVTTIAELLEVVYGSAKLKKLASILSIVSLFMILVAQIIASQKFLVSLGLHSTYLFIAFWTVVIFYTAQGGLKSVISTDIVQAAFFSFIFFACFALVSFTGTAVPKMAHSISGVSTKLWGWLLMPLLFMVVEQDMGQRCFAGATPRIVSRAAILAGICSFIVCLIPVFFGSLAGASGLAIPEGGSVLMTAIAATTNPLMTALVACAVLAAVISTATSLINAISSNLANDFRKVKGLRGVKEITCALSAGAIFFAFFFDNIVDLLIQSYEFSVCCLFVPVLMALYGKEKEALPAWLALGFGAFSFFLFRFCPLFLPKEIASLILSFIGYAIGGYYVRSAR
jgi:solute:Na+ symporter, SSS family